ncbi:helix-turn-helix domain-containing protein [Bradyrhizobium sp. CCBAU 65884]|uniref:helix-turn-helix domain-containing protein n=1 Tax=Bradyrhizobium sp. CCBAU 65884 TaxID=722477 RepID=UPI0023059F01|nr:helix-turn-helix domain-containing protein [Bradyrhizobium sp. CCBAU 65884]
MSRRFVKKCLRGPESRSPSTLQDADWSAPSPDGSAPLACPILHIAFEVGFGDASHFNRMFRLRFGETPSGVRAGSTMRE